MKFFALAISAFLVFGLCCALAVGFGVRMDHPLGNLMAMAGVCLAIWGSRVFWVTTNSYLNETAKHEQA